MGDVSEVTKRSKKLVMLLALALLALGLAALSGTFASTVDYNTEKKNVAENKSYYVDVQYVHSNSGTAEYADLLNTTAFSDSSKWCPGRTEIIYLKLTNKEAFPINCTVDLNVTESEFDSVLSYSVMEGDLLYNNKENHPTSWADYVSKAGNLSTVLSKGKYTLLEEETLIGNAPCYLALAIHMDENATSEYENKTLKMNFILRYDAMYEPGEIPDLPAN